MLAIFLCAFYLPRIGGRAMFWAAVIAEATVGFCAAWTSMAWLWWNVVGCVVGVVAALLIQSVMPPRSRSAVTQSPL